MTADPRLANATARIAKLEDELQAERNRNRSVQTMVESTSWQRFVTLSANVGQYKDTNVPALVKLLHVLQEAVDASDPLRGAPMSDTARVGHPELTSTEAAVMSKRKERALVRRANQRIGELIDWLEADMTGEAPKVAPRRCHSSHCQGKRSPAEARNCMHCGKPFKSKEEAA